MMASYWGDKSMDPDSLYSVLNMRMRITNFLNSSFELKSTQVLLEKQKKKRELNSGMFAAFLHVTQFQTHHFTRNCSDYKTLCS